MDDDRFGTSTVDDAPDVLTFVSRFLKDERGIVLAPPALEVSAFEVRGLRMAHVFYESGLAINVMCAIEDGGRGVTHILSRHRAWPM